MLLPVSKATAEVKVQLFTTAFRKVQEKDFASIPNGRMTLYMEDTWGNPLASGLYYVVVVEEGRRFMTKLLLLR